MRIKFLSPIVAGVLLTGIATISSGLGDTSGAATSVNACNKITKAVMVANGYSNAVSPSVTPYNYAKTSSNPANALGNTIDFGAKALVVGCVSPADIKKLSASVQGSSKTTMTTNEYMAYMVKQSGGAMTKTPVGGVSDYLDFGSGKEDGLGSTSTAGSIRLDAWVAGRYIILTFSAPASATPPKALLNFIKATKALL
ncbi:MAG TPA: hypothetical protein VII65_00835 [Acidimicrobiales bacterium]